MYHLNERKDILETPYYQKTKSICPECMDKIDAEIFEENDEIFMKKHCSKCQKDFSDKLSSSAK